MSHNTAPTVERLRDHAVLLACVIFGALYIGDAFHLGAPVDTGNAPVSMTQITIETSEFLLESF